MHSGVVRRAIDQRRVNQSTSDGQASVFMRRFNTWLVNRPTDSVLQVITVATTCDESGPSHDFYAVYLGWILTNARPAIDCDLYWFRSDQKSWHRLSCTLSVRMAESLSMSHFLSLILSMYLHPPVLFCLVYNFFRTMQMLRFESVCKPSVS